MGNIPTGTIEMLESVMVKQNLWEIWGHLI